MTRFAFALAHHHGGTVAERGNHANGVHLLARSGQVTRLHWLRAPSHAPEVVAEIERIVRQAAPYPAPRVAVTYTDTWLWDRSGRFQLDTLTEGQL